MLAERSSLGKIASPRDWRQRRELGRMNECCWTSLFHGMITQQNCRSQQSDCHQLRARQNDGAIVI